MSAKKNTSSESKKNNSKKSSQSRRNILKIILGEITWKPPNWIKTFGKSISKPLSSAAAWMKKHPKLTLSLGILFIVVIAAGIFLYLWFISRPEPVRFTFDHTSPNATILGENPVPDPIIVNFNGSVARLDQIGKPVEKGITMTPPFAGQWEWTDDSSLKFTPAQDWPISQQFTVNFAPALFPDHVELETYSFQFKTADFSIKIPNFIFYEDPGDPKIKKVVATVKFSHPVEPEEFEKNISLLLQEEEKKVSVKDLKPYNFTVSYDKFYGEAYVHSDPITIPEKDGFMRLIIAKGVQSSRGGPSTKTEITGQARVPGMYNYFNIRTASITLVENEKKEMEQVLVINTSTGVLESEIRKNLTAYILPKDRPAHQGQAEVKNYRWHNVSEIGPEIIEASGPLDLIPIPTDREFATLHSYKFQAPVNRYLYVKINKGILSFGGYILASDFDRIEVVPSYPQTLEIMSEGSLLSLSGEKKISILTRNLPAVRVELSRVLPGQINHLVSQTRGNFKDPYFQNYNFDSDN
ncbi:MAG: hypothetical protein JW755_01845, partial [Candidatus Aminicenantes bacterium]|nr:hypothetical protein [Candidatus Aminicenantes bacterium]